MGNKLEEMNRPLKVLVEQKKKEAFIEPNKATDEEALGILIATYFEWDSRIIRCFLEALEDANFHTLRGQIEELIS